MKINLYTTQNTDGEILSEDLAGITTFDTLHSGQKRVEIIQNIRVNHDGSLSVLVKLMEPQETEVVDAIPL